MLQFILWYFLVSLLGVLTFPLAFRLLPALADRGYTLSRALGLLIWAYLVWLLASFGFIRNELSGWLLALILLTGLSWMAARQHGQDIKFWLRNNLKLVFSVEILFLLAFAAWAFVRAANPDITGTEKPMELAFINAILKSPTFPPHDPWLSGYAISYYYFGFVMTALLAGFTNTAGAVAFNLMLALIFALAAIGSYGLLFNLLSAYWRGREQTFNAAGFSFLSPLFLLIISNLQAVMEVLHRMGLFWTVAPDGSATSSFWSWLAIRDLTEPPTQPLGWLPDRYWWWWRASRVVHDFDLADRFTEVIDEFPFFSFLLGDLHPHVLAIPFVLLAASLALHLFLREEEAETKLLGFSIPFGWKDFGLYGLVLGGLAFINTWDFPIYFAITLGALLLRQVLKNGWNWQILEDVIKVAIPLGVISIVFYLPFYAGFSSQAGGILPNVVNPTRGVHLWLMFGSLFVPIFAWLFWLIKREALNPKTGWLFAIAIPTFLWLVSLLLSFLSAYTPLGQAFVASQGVGDVWQVLGLATLRRIEYSPALLTLVLILGFGLSYLTATKAQGQPAAGGRSPLSFILFLMLMAAVLVMTPDFIYLRDQFGSRMNTVFKFYYQAWILWSVVAAFGTALLFAEQVKWSGWLGRVLVLVVAGLGLIYPVLSLPNKTNNFAPYDGFNLDGSAFMQRYMPDDAAAIQVLKQLPLGVVAEAVGGSYSEYARMATFSGQANVLGWPGHEGQWRGGGEEMGNRQADMETLYSTSDWSQALAILEMYDVRYVVVGTVERYAYAVNEDKFAKNLREIFRQGQVVLYEVP